MNRLTSNFALTAISWILGSLVFALALVVVWQVLSPQGRVSCGDFLSLGDARDAYRKGAYWLDGDKDGIPCESLFL